MGKVLKLVLLFLVIVGVDTIFGGVDERDVVFKLCMTISQGSR